MAQAKSPARGQRYDAPANYRMNQKADSSGECSPSE